MKEGSKKTETGRSGEGYMHGIAIDAVIFGFHDQQLKVLLMQYKASGIFALPGGFIQNNEDLNTAAERVVSQRTGLKDIYLEQFYVFGDHGRFDPSAMKTIMTANNIPMMRIIGCCKGLFQLATMLWSILPK